MRSVLPSIMVILAAHHHATTRAMKSELSHDEEKTDGQATTQPNLRITKKTLFQTTGQHNNNSNNSHNTIKLNATTFHAASTTLKTTTPSNERLLISSLSKSKKNRSENATTGPNPTYSSHRNRPIKTRSVVTPEVTSTSFSTTMECRDINGKAFFYFDIPKAWPKHENYGRFVKYFYSTATNCGRSVTTDDTWTRDTDIYITKNNQLVAQKRLQQTRMCFRIILDVPSWPKTIISTESSLSTKNVNLTNNLTLELEKAKDFISHLNFTTPLSVTSFRHKNSSESFRRWDIDEQEQCFLNTRVKSFRVYNACPNITVIWENHKFIFNWYIYDQHLKVINEKTKELKYEIFGKHIKAEHVIAKLAYNTNYRVCLTTIYTEKEEKECKDICLCCNPYENPKRGELSINWWNTLLIVVTIGSLCSTAVMCVLYRKRMRRGRNQHHRNNNNNSAMLEISPRPAEQRELFSVENNQHKYYHIMESANIYLKSITSLGTGTGKELLEDNNINNELMANGEFYD